MESDRDNEPGPSYLLPLAIHGVLGTLGLLFLLFVVPVLAEMFADFGAFLPEPTSAVVALATTVRRHGVLIVGALPILLVADGAVASLLGDRVDPVAGTLWCWAVTIVLTMAIALCITAMFLPMFRMSEVVGGGAPVGAP